MCTCTFFSCKPLLAGKMKVYFLCVCVCVWQYDAHRARLKAADGNELDCMFVDRRGSPDVHARGNRLVICCEGNAAYYELGLLEVPAKGTHSLKCVVLCTCTVSYYTCSAFEWWSQCKILGKLLVTTDAVFVNQNTSFLGKVSWSGSTVMDLFHCSWLDPLSCICTHTVGYSVLGWNHPGFGDSTVSVC